MGPMLEAWKAASGPLIDEIAGEIKKHDIEEMESDREYEEAIVGAMVEAFDNWEYEGRPNFNSLPIDQKLQIADIGLNETKYGSYRGNLPDEAVVRSILLGEEAPENTMILTFEMPGDQEWDTAMWERLGVGGDWENLGKAFYNLGVQVEDDDDVSLEFEPAKEPQVRQVIEAARAGKFGPDVQKYWSAASEV